MTTTTERPRWRRRVPTPVFHTLTVADVERLTDDAVAVTFDVPAELADAYAFDAGQSLTLRRIIDGDEHRRSYSICAPVGARPRVGVRAIPDGPFSSLAGQRGARPATEVEVQTPTGSFRADPRRRRPAPVHRRRLRHHADALDRHHRAAAPRRAR